MSPDKYGISIEKQATMGQYIRRQIFVTPPVVSRQDADLAGKTAIVTGSNIGIGLETARQLLDLGLSRLILGVRDEAKGEAARQDLLKGRKLDPSAVEVWKLDHAAYDSVAEFAKRAAALERLDIAVLNAGIFRKDESFHPSTGYEEDVHVNYMSTSLLALLLLPALKAKSPGSPPGRMTLVSSDMAGWSKFAERTSDPLLAAFKQKAPAWDMGERYGTSKLLGQLLVSELTRNHLDPSAVIVDTVNPGFCYGSGLQRDGKNTVLGFVFGIVTRILGRPSAVGARSVIAAVVKFGEDVHGEFVEDGRIRPSAPLIYSPEGKSLAKKLWDETLEEFAFAGVPDIIRGLGAKV